MRPVPPVPPTADPAGASRHEVITRGSLATAARSGHPDSRRPGGVPGGRPGRAQVIDAICRVLTSPALDGRYAGPSIVQKRKDVKKGCNKAPETVFDLLEANGRADEFASLITRAFATSPLTRSDMKAALIKDMDAKCAEMPELSRVLAGDETTPELVALRAKVLDNIAAEQLMLEVLDSEIAARRLGMVA